MYYELGLAHALDKHSITLVEHDSEGVSNNFKTYLQGYSSFRNYSPGINALKSVLEDSNPKPNVKNRVKKPAKPCKKDSIVCIIPHEYNEVKIHENGSYIYIPHVDKNKCKEDHQRVSFRDVFKVGIKKAISEIPGRTFAKDKIYNILDIAYNEDKDNINIEQVIKHIQSAKYCIIDVTEGYPEVFYWLGFIHGLAISGKIHDDNDDGISYMYITQGKMRELPFDIQAARVSEYHSVEEVYGIIQKEVEKQERDILKEANKGKYEFWSKIKINETRFYIGAGDVYPPGYNADNQLIRESNNKPRRDRISIQDFRTFNRLNYTLLFDSASPLFQYDLKIPIFADFLVPEDSTNPATQVIYLDKKNSGKIRFPSKSNDANLNIRNHIIIGSNVVNAVVELIMLNLYVHKDVRKELQKIGKKIKSKTKSRSCLDTTKNIHEGYVFRTMRPYKSRSVFWKYMEHLVEQPKEEGVSELGIFVNAKNGKKTSPITKLDYLRINHSEDDQKPFSDSALLVIANDIDDTDFTGVKVDGKTILLFGFSKYGTYALGHMLSYYYNDKRAMDIAEETSKIYFEKNKKTTIEYDVNTFFDVINSQIQIEKRKNQDQKYCIEVVFEFRLEVNVNIEIETKQCLLRKFCTFNRSTYKRESLLKELQTKQETKDNKEVNPKTPNEDNPTRSIKKSK
ncbi:MAG: hypothetical protein KAS32_16580 [Candidatus Peribacteraceae bacterium]|nr:hypothetical protein [Candidatus Peribacteraceae bacterium]